MVYYCAVMILLLAFFIVLQTMSEGREDEAFERIQGSFIHALETLGLGVLRPDRSRRPTREVAPRYKQKEGVKEEPRRRIIDPDDEAARRALMELRNILDVEKMDDAVGYRVEVATPIEYYPGKTELSETERRFIQRLAPRLESAILARRFVVRISSSLPVGIEEVTEEDADAALELASLIRRELISAMSPLAREIADKRLYSFLRTDEVGRVTEDRTLRIDVLLTKPYSSLER